MTRPENRQPVRRSGMLVMLGAGLILVMVAGMLMGAVKTNPADLVHMVGRRLGLIEEPERLTDAVLWAIRFPRVVAGAVVGAGLGVAGAALQGTFRNQMSDPYLVGLAPAAGLGAIAGIALTPVGGPALFMVMGASIAGAAAALVMRRIEQRVIDPNQFVLVGLALGLAMLAWLGAIVLAWDSPRVPTLNFWVFGGLAGSTWALLIAAAPIVAIGSAILALSAGALDVFALGEAEARHVGVNVDRVTILILVGVGLAVGGAVALGGAIGFVGLIVPLFVRRAIGPIHRWLIPASALGGAAMVVSVDLLARTIAAPIEIPVGLFTAIVGAPVFVWFLLRVGRVRT